MSNLISLQQPEKLDLHDEILSELGAKKARGVEIELYEVIDVLDLEQNYSKIRDWIVKERIASKSEWNKAIENKKRKDALGGTVTTAREFLELWIRKNAILADYKNGISHNVSIYHDGYDVCSELMQIQAKLEDCKSATESLQLRKTCQTLQDIIGCKTSDLNVEDLSRQMRIKARELGFSFSAMDIDDVIQEWLKEQRNARKYQLFAGVKYEKGLATGDKGKAMWKDMAESLFDTEDKDASFCIAILKKFMWQVKRKMRNLPVTNHLMPILLGPQGVGKTSFINKMLEPLHEGVAATDFSQITDDRNINLWENFALVLDEMGYATKADIDIVKNLVTANTLTRRIMRTNNAIHVKQNASFIGASNREIEQIIRDETGARRFIGIRFKNEPNFPAMERINFTLLWQSVDECGPDPLQAFGNKMRIAQESIRVTNPTEEWVITLPKSFNTGKFFGSSYLYLEYKEWEKKHYGRRQQDHDEWGKEMRRLIYNSADFPMEMKKNAKGWQYRYTGNGNGSS